MTAPSLSVLFPSYDPPYLTFADLDELRALASADLTAISFALVADSGLFVWTPDSSADDDTVETIKPDDVDSADPGRWLATVSVFNDNAREAADDAEAARDAAQAAAAAATASSLQAADEEAEAALYAAAAEAFAGGLYADTAAGITGTTNGEFFLVVGTGNSFATLYKNVSGVATAQSLAIPSLAALTAQTASVTTALAAVQTAKTQVLNSTKGYLPEGWVEPNEYTDVSWINVLGIKFYGDGFKYWPMLPDASTTLAAWRVAGGPRKQFPDTGVYWVAVSIARIHDFTTTGSTTHLYVNVNTGNNANDGLSIGAPKKTLESAITAINAASAGRYQINLITTDFIPSNSEGWNPGGLTIAAGRQVKIYAVPRADGSKPWWLPGMRRAGYAKANFAWSNIGDGWWKSTAVGISAAAKNTPIVFDLSVLDENGMPSPSIALTGTLADDAAVKAAADGKPAFYYRSSDVAYYVKLASGAEPDPGNNFAYVEANSSTQVLVADTGRVMFENFRVVHNSASTYGIMFQVRPQTVYLGPTNPVYDHDIHAIFKGVECYGSSGNAFVFYDCDRSVAEDFIDGYCYLDGVNQSSYYTPGNSNGTGEGSDQHCFVDGHLSLYHGPCGFKDQLAANTSSNTFTAHSRCNMTVLNSRGGFSNGSGVAIVGGAKCLLINVNGFAPKYVTPSTDVYPAPFLASGNGSYNSAIKSEIWAIHCSGMTRPNGRVFYVGPTARIVAVSFRGTVTKQVASGGILHDGYGNNL